MTMFSHASRSVAERFFLSALLLLAFLAAGAASAHALDLATAATGDGKDGVELFGVGADSDVKSAMEALTRRFGSPNKNDIGDDGLKTLTRQSTDETLAHVGAAGPGILERIKSFSGNKANVIYSHKSFYPGHESRISLGIAPKEPYKVVFLLFSIDIKHSKKNVEEFTKLFGKPEYQTWDNVNENVPEYFKKKHRLYSWVDKNGSLLTVHEVDAAKEEEFSDCYVFALFTKNLVP